MSNDRVRIYDLSRDLNLDNKSVLELCDRLNVSYKTCSSTITEEEAERIRQAVQNRPSPPRPIPRSEARPHSPKSKEAPAPKNKELQIRSYTYRQTPETETASKPEAPVRRDPPRPHPSARPQPPQRPEQRPQRPTLRSPEAPVSRTTPATPRRPTVTPAPPPEPAVPALKTPRPRPELPPEPSTVEVVLFPPKAKPDSKAPTKRKSREQELADEERLSKLNSPKGKRRHRGRDLDEDEDLDFLELESTHSEASDGANSTASVYLMRPPKPKSSTPTTVKPNRPQANRPRRSEPVNRISEAVDTPPTKPEFLEVTGSLTVQQLAEQLAVPETEVIKTLFLKGKMVTVTQALDLATIEQV
ncbi:MAG: translation initiation factor IF-2 N-terminal domain-containing protein, partial [Gloeomargarita sp. HHBFW_bins_162]